ncbi:family 78 glycoside hydrolase catalytic domain [Cohnella zeiphila]|uniref:alpha-L-rhamnosidase n=1 Tax=Cohnella zeiphila TaxID=2761120 RepID=A0A7X0SMC0_9BACL|nr:family 78 glycoside hydrolase catalytic domain [Cohnella zeiphila]MBB6731340.1 family 78 glycoside hydrolase catalytic domain [Cohnella zeiphila]
MENSLRIVNLQVEHMENPIGVGEARPRFGWGFVSAGGRGESQSAYQILVASEEERLSRELADVWDSGKVVSRQNRNVAYEGVPLQSGRRYYWKVRAWDASGRAGPYSSPGIWEMAYLHPEDWQAEWIGVTADDRQAWAEKGVTDAETALPLFRTTFQLSQDAVRARASICGLGHFELRLNGEKVGDHALAPGWTNYDKTCLYTVLDATPYVRKGKNAIGILLGNGFYNVTGGRYAKLKGSFGNPKLILQLEVEHADGTVTRIRSGEGWSVSRSPITFSCIYGGEDYNALLEEPGWDRAEFAEDNRWRKASVVPAPRGKLAAQNHPPIQAMEQFAPVQVTESSPGVYVYDFGQNFSGRVRIKIKGKAPGSTVTLKPAELVDEQGGINTSWNISFSYTTRGDGEESWEPRFTYTGFRYVQVEGAVPQEIELEGQMIYAAAPTIGSFSCSNDMWNQIHQIINMAIKSNMQSVLTDCPHREKLGWLEEAHLMGPSIMYNYYVPQLYRKVMDDMREAQLDNGLVPDIAPEYTVFDHDFRDSPEWGSAYIIAAWYVYNWYQDRGLLERHYEGMKNYAAYLSSKADGYMVRHGLGDWCDVGPNPGYPQNTPIPVTATAIYYYVADIMKQMASVLGKDEDSKFYAELAVRIREAYNAEFLDREACRYASGSQTSNAMPLALGMVPDGLEETIAGNIVRDIRARGNSMTGGDVGFRYLLMALTKYNRAETVADMLLKTDHPSYGYQIAHGATALTELWDGPTFGLSQNHFMLGHIEEWFYSVLAGIRVSYEIPSLHHLAIAPRAVGGVEWVRAHHDLVQGRVEVYWHQDSDRWLLEVTIPVNTTATVHIPDALGKIISEGGNPLESVKEIERLGKEGSDTLLKIGSGTYTFEVRRM